MEGEMVPAVRTGAVLWVSWNLTVAMLCKEEFGAALIVKLLSEKESEDKDEVTEGGGMMSSSKFVGGGGVGLSCLWHLTVHLARVRFLDICLIKIKEEIYVVVIYLSVHGRRINGREWDICASYGAWRNNCGCGGWKKKKKKLKKFFFNFYQNCVRRWGVIWNMKCGLWSVRWVLDRWSQVIRKGDVMEYGMWVFRDITTSKKSGKPTVLQTAGKH